MNSSASLMYSALALTSSSVAMHTMCKISCVLNVSYSQSLSDRIAFTAPTADGARREGFDQRDTEFGSRARMLKVYVRGKESRGRGRGARSD